MFVEGEQWDNVLETQHYLCSERNISLETSNQLALFEFETHRDILARDMKKKAEKAAELKGMK